MDVTEMSERTHFWLRLVAIAVIAAAAWLPRGSTAQSSASSARHEAQAPRPESTVIQAAVVHR